MSSDISAPFDEYPRSATIRLLTLLRLNVLGKMALNVLGKSFCLYLGDKTVLALMGGGFGLEILEGFRYVNLEWRVPY
jgi:hypothetical protein